MTDPATSDRRWWLIGAGAAMLGAMLFACKGIVAKLLLARGVDFESITGLRALIAMPAFIGLAAARHGGKSLMMTPRRAAITASVAGVLCYYLGALANFYALTMIDASIERAIIFSYPAVVVVLQAALRRRLPTAAEALAALLAYLGVFLAVGGWHSHVLEANLVGGLLVLFSAATYAIYYIAAESCVRQIGSVRFTMYSMSASALALGAHLTLRGHFAAVPRYGGDVWLLLLLISVVCMVFPALLQAEGVRRIGASAAAVVSAVGPPTTIALGWLLLDERITTGQWFGVVAVVGGVLLIDRERRRRGSS
ncbi:MAG: DMT family transporter [Steroidobacteraceae bacterium]